jgi:Fe-Mn family superoxide dismutase
MSELKVAVILVVVLVLGLQFTFIAQAQETSEKQMEKNLTNNQSNNQIAMNPTNKFEFQPLPYGYDALEPYIDKLTLEIHYSKHHRAYYDNFIKAIKGTEVEFMDIMNIFKHISDYPDAIRNNGGGYFNHTFYWESMKANGGELPTGKLSEALVKTFGSFEEFRKQFSDAGKTRFGSGWAWLCMDDKGVLFVCSTPNQDNPLMDLPNEQTGIAERKGIPLLTMDVWEHAYYLKYQNRRPDYIDAFWNIINWEEVGKRYENALSSMNTK